MRVAMLDNRDSFTYNLVHACAQTGAEVAVWRESPTLCADIFAWRPTHIVLSPGPQRPTDHPALHQMLDAFAGRVPMLGVCLGMQGMNEWAGGNLRRDHPPMHGKTSAVTHDGRGLFAGIPSPCRMMRYHSLALDDVAPDFIVTACAADNGTVMAIAHRTLPLWGVQFHPESYQSEWGNRLVENFMTQ